MKRTLHLVAKRWIDVFGSVLGLVLLSPLLLCITIVITMTTKGGVFFFQKRLGKEGRVFQIIKFRTMIANAEALGDGLHVKNNQDSRITKVGKFLRDFSLDELPQLINVIKGDMSLVGPRPPVTYHPYAYDAYDGIKKTRFQMRPGITGLSQVMVRNSVSWDERILYDVQYVKEFTIRLDMKILMQTTKKVLHREQIYGK